MLYAKKHYEDGKLVKETIAEHIDNVIKVSDEIVKVFPELINNLDNKYISGRETVFLTVSLHDMGKCTRQFQTITLNPDSNEYWNFRHEILSCEFVNLIKLDNELKNIIELAILGHHEKDIHKLSNVCYSENMDLMSMFDIGGDSKKKDIYEDAHEGLYYYWNEICKILDYISLKYKNKFQEELNISKNFDNLGSGCNIIEQYYLNYNNASKYNYKKILLLKGILITCDHLGSGHNDICSINMDIKKYFMNKFSLKRDKDFRVNQYKSITTEDSILISPTGSGKTEASFLWANEHLKFNNNRRIFYVLPYTASINGMYYRLQEEDFSKNKVDIKHGKAAYSYFKGLLDKYNNSSDSMENIKKIEKEAKLMKQTSREICKPVKIVTPHQIIKAFYRVKGYESLITEFQNSLFIFDEIHCYNDELLAMIIVVMSYIKKEYNGKLFFMSATFPEVVKNIITAKLNINNVITMPNDELKKYARNKFNLIDGLIENNVEKIYHDIENNKRVLIICNTIKKAQLLYKKIKEKKEFKNKNILLLHSYFAQRDRDNIEEKLLNGEKNIRRFKKVDILIGTQAIEVSLDLDFDILYTELAPIDALAQRFGRVFRKRKSGYGIVNIFTEWDKGTEFIYNDKELKFLDKTLQKLHEYNGIDNNIVNDIMLQEIINYVYNDDYAKKIYKNIEIIEEKFSRIKLIPLLDYSRESQEFFEQFDGYKICPECYLEEYKECIQNGLYIKASSYLININEIKLIKYLKNNSIFKNIFKLHNGKEDTILVANSSYFDYNSEMGLEEKDNGIGLGKFL
ncbi:MAG TPA: hypothetical protein DD426_07120 [Clostridiaceae bacterium]|nr:hypothetical protein [Clostridiaceae bacterium]